jgi:hypothetical protein
MEKGPHSQSATDLLQPDLLLTVLRIIVDFMTKHKGFEHRHGQLQLSGFLTSGSPLASVLPTAARGVVS